MRNRTDAGMAQGHHATMPEILSTEFDGFLFAPIGDDAAGMPLTVLTTLARLNLDPWEEAASLIRLPLESATQRLAALLDVPQIGYKPHADSATTATRLLKLLHDPPAKRPRSAGAVSQREVDSPVKRISKSTYYVFALVLMLIGLWAMAVDHPEATSGDGSAPAAPR